MILYPLLRLIIVLWGRDKAKNTISCPLGHHKRKWAKNVIFHDFFKFFLSVLRWYYWSVEMFLRPPEGILSVRIHIWPISRKHKTSVFSVQMYMWSTIGLHVHFRPRLVLSTVTLKLVKNVEWDSKHLLEVPKTYTQTYIVI